MNLSKRIIVFSLIILTVLFCTSYITSEFFPKSTPYTIDSVNEKITPSFVPPTPCKSRENIMPPDEFHIRFVEPDLPLSDIMKDKGYNSDNNVNIYVDIKTRTLFFKYRDETLKKYRISTGSNTDIGDKEKEGDSRTPRGNFYICSRDVYSPPKGYLGSRWMLLSYPNLEAAERGLDSGLIDEATYKRVRSANLNKRTPPQNTILGSAIGIHGGAQENLRRDWTLGCIGMYNEDVEEIFEFVKIGTPVLIE